MDDFDAFCETHDITDDELPAAFAAWLNGATGWDSTMHRIDEKHTP